MLETIITAPETVMAFAGAALLVLLGAGRYVRRQGSRR